MPSGIPWNTIAIEWRNIPEVTDDDWIGVWTTDPKIAKTDPIELYKVDSPNGSKLLNIQWRRKLISGIPTKSLNSIPKCSEYWVRYIRQEEVMLSSCLQLRPHWMQEISKSIIDLSIADVILPGIIYLSSKYHKYPKLNNSPWYDLAFGARYLHIFVYFDEQYQKYFTLQDHKISLIRYLYEVYSFIKQSNEIIVLKIEARNDDKKSQEKLRDLIITLLHDQLVPKNLEPNPTFKKLWGLNRHLIVICPQLKDSKYIWTDITTVHYSDLDWILSERPNQIYGRSSLWELNIDYLGDDSKMFFEHVNNNLWKTLNIITFSCLPCTNLVEMAIQANMRKVQCPVNEKSMRLLRKLSWRGNMDLSNNFLEECSSVVPSIRVWPTIKAQPEFVRGKLTFRLIQINWEANELDPNDVVAIFEKDPSNASLKIIQEQIIPIGGTSSPVLLAGVNGNLSVVHSESPIAPETLEGLLTKEEVMKPLYAARPFATVGLITSTVTFDRPNVSELSKGGCVGPWVAFLRNGSAMASRCIAAHPTWMWTNRAALAHHPLRSLVIPGSHNSGSYSIDNAIDPVSVWVACQDEDVITQLLYGIRYLDLRVGYYPDTEELLWINHDMVRWLPLKDVLNDVKAFSFLSPDPVIIDIHRTPVGFDADEAPKLLISLIKTTLGDYLSPYAFGDDVTLDAMWRSGKTVLVSFGAAWLRKEVPWLWPPVFQAWANAQVLEDLRSYLDQKMKMEPKLGKLWAAMGHMTPSVWDIVFKVDVGVRGMADSTGKHLTYWLRERWGQDANIMTSDFFHTNDIIYTALLLNMMRDVCREKIPRAVDFETSQLPSYNDTSTVTTLLV